MADSQSLFDTLAGAAGHPVNRPALDAFVANSQARNGLVSAQTEEAMLGAQKAREEQEARGGLFDTFVSSGMSPSDARMATQTSIAGFGNAKVAMDALRESKNVKAAENLGDPTKIGDPSQTASQQLLQGKVATPEAIHPEYAVLPGMTPPTVLQTPLGEAQTAAQNANAGLHSTQAAAGGFNPHTGGGSHTGDPQMDAALDQAIKDGRLDPSRVNSRTATIFAGIEQRNPGAINFNRMTADAALQKNATFQQKAMSMEALPTVLAHMTALGKKIGYSDNRTVGKMQQFMNGEFNDPDYTEYMAVRNDALMNVASLMRGIGMSDQAHKAEMEAGAPTLSPLALDGWLKGQMSVMQPRLDQQRRVTHLGEHHAASPATGTTPAAADPNDPLGLRSK